MNLGFLLFAAYLVNRSNEEREREPVDHEKDSLDRKIQELDRKIQERGPIAKARAAERAARIKREEEEREIEDLEERRIMNEIRNQYTNRK